MRKIPTLFVRDWDNNPRYVTREITPGCEWVIAGEGVPTRKVDGACMMLDDAGEWWARREVKEGKQAPPGFAELGHDDETGKTVGWEPVAQSAFAKYHAEALRSEAADGYLESFKPGTYELCGPRVNGNPEAFGRHVLVPHEECQCLDLTARTYDFLAAWLHAQPYEGIVWHHPDGRMAKIKKRDFPVPGNA